jgi:signal transduction histidine kinase
MGIVKESGEITWLNVTAAPIPLMGYGEAITYQDVTRRKNAELELEKHREHLEEMIKERSRELEAAQDELLKREKLAVLGQLTATVSHELRNPLGVIRASTFYLLGKLQHREEKAEKHLARIDRQVDVCDRIVQDLLEYTRGKHSEMIGTEFKPWIEDTLDQITMPEKIELVQGFSPNLPVVRMDREKMQRVVINLMNNAISAVNERQKPEIENQGEDSYQPRIKVTAGVAENGVVIAVEDNGVGMNAETVQKAFDPLFTTRARGTGLGLAIVRKVVEEHGGSVYIESPPNRGTKVTVILPVHQQKNSGKLDKR